MTPLHLLMLGLVCTILTLSDNLVSGTAECPLTDQDFLRGRDIDVSLPASEGRDFHEKGRANYQGDIQLNPEQYEVIVEGKPKGRALELIGHWPRDGSVVNIPYVITACDLTDAEKANLARAIEEYKNKTCIRFIPRENDEADYLNIIRRDENIGGCASWLGKQFGEQKVYLDTYCITTVGTPIHELMHAIGYLHEQSRKDRDKYVTINWQNMASDAATQYQFRKCEHCDLQNSPYDYNSVMHYSRTAFSNNNLPTITAPTGERIGQRKGFSDLDIKGINDLYCAPIAPNSGCCDEVEVSGLRWDTGYEGTYVAISNISKDRIVYQRKNFYLHWDILRRSWTISKTLQQGKNQNFKAKDCHLKIGNKCPSACGVWEQFRGRVKPDGGWEFFWVVVPDIKVECKVNTAHCNNTVRDSDETGVDCGGVSCPACPDAVDGGWGTWSSWSKCNAKCPKANGKQMRTRKCDNPEPDHGGNICVGDEKEEKNCKLTCSIDGKWGKWSQWSKCNAKCPKTNGRQVRTRKCNKPAPVDGGKKCVGKNKGARSCKIKCSSTPCTEKCKNKNKKCSSCKRNKCKSKKVQKQCPVTCNKCKSGGSGGNKPCKDKAGAKKCKKDKKKCKKNKTVQKNCAKTCNKCK